ncbi:MAG: hypothetical protein J6P58_05315, partial [Oscillospiraceae bacterium]|nr:hypothetical protein [Oscillospiraceae bacterium]
MGNKMKTGINNVDVRIGVGIVLALLLAHGIPGDLIQKLAACTAVIMCTQENASFGWRSALTRVEGVVIGGVIAVLVVLLDGLSGNDYV